jgi:hypothetical protein
MVSATIEQAAPVMTLADAVAAIQSRNSAILAALTQAALTVDGTSYMMYAAVEGGTDFLLGGKSKGNGIQEKDEHKMVRALAAEKGVRWIILVPDAPELDEHGVVKVKRPEGAVNRAYADLTGIGAIRPNVKKGKLITAESQALPAAVKKGMPAQPKKEALAAALLKSGPDADAVVALYNDHQRIKAELLTIVTKWY